MMREESGKHVVTEKYAGKFVSPQEMLNMLKKNETNRMWILKQLSQLGINTSMLEEYSLNELHRECDQIIRSTYSIKYLGMNQNEMGIISRRIDPYKESNFNLSELPQSTYTVNKFFFSKPLKVGKRSHKEEKLSIENLEEEIKNAFTSNGKENSRPHARASSRVKGSWMSSGRQREREGPEKKDG